MPSLGRFVRTVAHLRGTQVVGRLTRLLPAAPLDVVEAPPIRRAAAPWVPAIERAAAYVDARHVRFLNVVHAIDDASVWRSSQLSKLWRYHLHYFDDLNAAGAAARAHWHAQLLERWVIENPPPAGEGWQPYPTSLRIVNWIKWTQAGNRLSERCLLSLAQQAAWLARNLEHHLLGNHLFENAKALLFAGLFFEGALAERWLATGWRILREQLAEQVLEDGGHFELSPMYHALVLDGILDVRNIARRYGVQPADEVISVCPKMLTWLEAMSHPDGRIALFNDATLDEAPTHLELQAYARRLGIEQREAVRSPLHVLPESGYARVQLGPAVALLDFAQLGPDYLPAHGHADTLTFELSSGGQRIVVDTGVSTYEIGARRAQERSTAAHNTWSAAGSDSSEVWAGFRVGRRARVRSVNCEAAAERVQVQAEHDGYAHLKNRAIHRRAWTFTRDGLVICDEFTGQGNLQLRGALHLHPSMHVAADGPGRWLVRDASQREVLAVTMDAQVETTIESYDYAPNFGELQRAPMLRFAAGGALPVAIETRIAYRVR